MSANGEPLVAAEHLEQHFPIKDGVLFDREVASVRAVDDVTIQAQIIALLDDLRGELGSVVLITHDLGVVAEIGTRGGAWARSSATRSARSAKRAGASRSGRGCRSCWSASG